MKNNTLSALFLLILLIVTSSLGFAHETSAPEYVSEFLETGDFKTAYEHINSHLSEATTTESKEYLLTLMEMDDIVGDTNMLLLNSLALVEQSTHDKDSFNEMIGYYYLGKVYYRLYDDPKAIEYFEMVLDIAENETYPLGIGLYNYAMGLIDYSYEYYDSALAYFQNAKGSFDLVPMEENWIFANFASSNDAMLSFSNALVNLSGEALYKSVDETARRYMSANWPMKLNALWDAAVILNRQNAEIYAVPLLEEAVNHISKADFGLLETRIPEYLNYDLAYAYYAIGKFEQAATLALEDSYDYDTKLEVDRAEFLNNKLRELETKSLREESLRQSRILGTISIFFLIVIVGSFIIYKEYLRIKKLTKEVYEKSIRDGLTGLLNRNAVIEKFELESTACSALGIIDIDNFKMINDFYGHTTGDQVIKEVALIIENILSGIGYAGRYGGEEFLVVINDGEKNNPYDVAETIRKNIEKISLESMNIQVTASIGIIKNTAHNFDDTFKLADQLLYSAKAAGKNKVHIITN